MATVDDVIKVMEGIASPNLAEDWDNVGLMLGRRDMAVKKILLALDLTQESFSQAMQVKANMIITHHPAIFKKLNTLTDASYQQELLLTCAENGVAVYSAHTNLDCAVQGVNDSLAAKLGLSSVEVLDDSNGLGRIGFVDSCSLQDFAKQVKEQLQADYVVMASAKRPVHKVAVCGGAGIDLIPVALAKGADTLVTGDVKYHNAQEAVYSGLNVIDAGHQATELPVLPDLVVRLKQELREQGFRIKIVVAEEEWLLTAV